MSTIITALITRATRQARTARRRAGMTRSGRDLGPPGVAAPCGPVPPRRRGPGRERRPRTPAGRSWRRAASALATAALAALALAITGSGTALASPASPPAAAVTRAAAGPPPPTASSGLAMMAGTSPSIGPLTDGGYMVAFQDTAGHLIVAWPGGHTDTGLGMKAGTSPAITVFATGYSPGWGYEVAFQANTGDLLTVGTAGNKDWHLGMMAGTSPAIAGTGGGWEVAFQASTGDLWTAHSSGASQDLGLGMMAGTSPAITVLDYDFSYEVAFQANTTDLYTVDPTENSIVDYHLGMMAGTSPAITGLDNQFTPTYQVAFQANTGDLWTAHSSGASQDLGLGMKAGTSPAIAGTGGIGYQLAYQTNTGDLRSLGNAGSIDYGLGVMAGTSPAITELTYVDETDDGPVDYPAGYQVAFQAGSGDLSTAGPGLLASPGHATAPSSAPATTDKKAAGTSATCNSSLPYTASTWMGDLAPCLQSQKIGDIVIPGSHDTTTFGLGSSFGLHDLWHTQDEWTSAQADDGMRQFDIRVEHRGTDWYAHHGTGLTDALSSWLTLQGIFADIARWAQTPGREHEVLLLNLTMENSTNDVAACQYFGQQMGDALVTPSDFAGSFGTTDPGQLTLNQLWSLPDPNGYARVIIDNAQCMGDAHLDAGTWGPFSPPGQSLYSGYYAGQVSAGGLSSPSDQTTGITTLVLQAVKGRATVGNGAEPILPGPPKVGGFYTLDIQGTPEADELIAPWDMGSDERTVLQALYSQWQTDPATRQNLNIVAGDYIEFTSLLQDVIAMDEAKFASPAVPAITSLKPGLRQVTVDFSDASAGLDPVTSYTVTATNKTNPAAPPETTTGPASPVTVTGLTNGDVYAVTVTATNANGTSPPSQPETIQMPAPPKIVSGPYKGGIIGEPYSSSFTVTGTPPPTVIIGDPHDLPPGLTVDSDGKVTGTPTQTGKYTFTAIAMNHYGESVDQAVTITILPPQ